jgi:hypothetical protein
MSDPKKLLTGLPETFCFASAMTMVRSGITTPAVQKFLKVYFKNAHEGPDAVKTVAAWPDGYRIVRLKTVAALEREGILMGHCLATKRHYHQSVEKPSSRFLFSLRDSANVPHATLEVLLHTRNGLLYRRELIQCRGKGNEPVHPKYMPYIDGFLRTQQIEVLNHETAQGVVKWNDVYHSLRALPEGVVINGNLNLEHFKGVFTLPKGSKITGGLTINGYGAPVDYTACDVNIVTIEYRNDAGNFHNLKGAAVLTIDKKANRIIGSEYWINGKRPICNLAM